MKLVEWFCRILVAIQFFLVAPVFCRAQEQQRFQYPGFNVGAQDSIHINALINEASILTDTGYCRQLLDSAEVLSRKKKFLYGLARTYLCRAVLACQNGAYKQSEALFEAAYPYCYSHAAISGTNRLLAGWTLNFSVLYSNKGNYHKTIKYGYITLDLLQQNPADSLQYTTRVLSYNTIGASLLSLNNVDQSLYYLEKGKHLAERCKDSVNQAAIYINIASAYAKLGDWQRAKTYAREAIGLGTATGDPQVLQTAYVCLSSLFSMQAVNDSAAYFLEKGKAVSGQIDPNISETMPALIRAQIYFDKKDYTNAARQAEIALVTARQMGAQESTLMAYEILNEIYSANHNWEKAHAQLQAYYKLKDSLKVTEELRDIQALNIKFKTAEKDKQFADQQLALLQVRSGLREKNIWIAGSSCCAVFLLLLLLNYRRSYHNKQKLQDVKISMLEKEMELEKLKAVMEGEEVERGRIARELHDGVVSQLLAVKLSFNATLDKMNYSQLKPADFSKSLSYLDQATIELRNTAHNLLSETILKTGLVTSIERYCNQVSEDTHLTFVFKHYGDLPPVHPGFTMSVFRIVQELILNVIKHARATQVLLQINSSKDFLSISVEDDGVGFESAMNSGNQGIGLYNIKNRIRSLHGQIEINSDSGGTSIYLEFNSLESIK